MEILRQRLFISHEGKEQRSIISEYTIKSKKEKLTNMIILSDDFLPNLTVNDEDGSILPVMNTKDVKMLIQYFIENTHHDVKESLENLYSKIDSEKLHLIWIKIPKERALDMDEIKTITLNYSPHQFETSHFLLKVQIKKQSCPLYYTLFTPSEFDFDHIRYGFIKNGKIKHSCKKPEYIQKFKTYNSMLFRIVNDIEHGCEITYSFKPTAISTSSTKIGLVTLTTLASIVLMLKYVNVFNDPSDMGIFIKQVEIGLFIIGGSLFLPQLTNNQSIRVRYTWWYLVPIVLGGLILL